MNGNESGRGRRRFLGRCAVAASAAMAGTVAAVERPKPKDALRRRTREEVGYRDEPYLGRSCAKCVLYQGHGECVILEGPVSPNGWCTQWVPASMG
ncbi:MAG: twin-arginine translocation signal domain-containing protein [Betaproteobacteria bacterium]|nr:twin-arginine translocation signal domain-containing protein [Betaproteobacteria bacterium]